MSDELAQEPTTGVLQWLQSQRAAGFDSLALYKALREAGWDHVVACQMVDLQPAASAPQAASADLALPWPRGAEECSSLDAGDRQVHALAVLREPNIVLLGDLLSPQECDALIDAARPRLARSMTVSLRTGGEEENAGRTSHGMFFERGETELIARIEARLAHLLDWPVDRGEGLQVLRYMPGAEYQPHYDYFDPREPGTASLLQRGGQRVATVVMYLNEPGAGGGTIFPDVRLQCQARQGHAVFFNYSRPHPSTYSLHGGSPVIRGEKWIATKWLRQQTFA